MDAETVADLLTRDRRTDRPALEDETGREFDSHWTLTSAWKAGNFLRHTGVRRDVTVGVVGDGPFAVLALLGTALLEGTTRFGPPTDLTDDEDFRTLVAPTDELAAYDLPRGAQRVGYGTKPDSPDVHYFDAGLWSENPSFPPVAIDPDTALVTDGGRTLSHGSALELANEVAETYGIDKGTRVAVGSFTDLRVVAAGLLAPLLAGGTAVLPGDGTEPGSIDLVAGDGALEAVDLDGAERIDLEALEVD